MTTVSDFGVYVGRLSPIHLGHQTLIDTLLREYGDRHLLLLGSCNHEISMRHIFSYQDRVTFVRRLYPDCRLTGLPDYQTDEEWLQHLDDILRAIGVNPQSVTFLGGCDEDVDFFKQNGRCTKIRNRFDGTSPKISATEVRDALIAGRSIKGLVDERLLQLIHETFRNRWEEFRKK